MKLEDQVVSLELAKRLKELGVKQKGAFYWKYSNGSLERKSGIKILTELKFGTTPTFQNAGTWLACSAFTVAELGEILPNFISVSGHDLALHWYRDDGQHYMSYSGFGKFAGSVYGYKENAKTEADARAAMLCHLIERKLVTPKETTPND